MRGAAIGAVLLLATLGGCEPSPDRFPPAPRSLLTYTPPPPPPLIVGQLCGDAAKGACSGGSFCQLPASAACTSSPDAGICAAAPAQCPRDFVPVCGCDGITYGNACYAAYNRVSIVHEGVCLD